MPNVHLLVLLHMHILMVICLNSPICISVSYSVWTMSYVSAIVIGN